MGTVKKPGIREPKESQTLSPLRVIQMSSNLHLSSAGGAEPDLVVKRLDCGGPQALHKLSAGSSDQSLYKE